MRTYLAHIWISLYLASCANAQEQFSPHLVGGPCEGCEAIFDYEARELSPIDTLADFHEEGVQIKVSGTIYQSDGKTPAKDIILYVYHTNQEGLYKPKGKASKWEKQHGYIRGWLKTNETGKYTFYTLKPAPYPGNTLSAHIHPTILEPGGKYYWLGSYHFEGDPLLTKEETNPESPRGGSSGLLKLRKEGDLMVGERDFILGKNVPGYE